MNNYPRIYSLSTAGVRQHNNADYLLHRVRTDFTGDNGLGKSIIADLMQLILIPRRDVWRPGTEGIDKNERRIEGIPLNKDYVHHAYTFLNVERYQGKFIVIGVYIPKNARLPVRPFIIQKDADFETKTSQLHSFDHPIKSSDFLNPENRQVLELKDLKEHLLKKYDVHLKDFYGADEINEYFDLLYKSQIMPIDLTKEQNLKTLAKVLQSFARAKTLDVNNSRSLQNFLFEDHHEIKSLFEEQKDQLVSYIKQYNNNRNLIKELQLKQHRLTELKALYETGVAAHNEYLKADAVFSFMKYRETKRLFDENRDRLQTAESAYDSSKSSIQNVSEAVYKHYLEGKSVSTQLMKQYEDLLPQYTDAKIDEKRREANRLFLLTNELEKVISVYYKYKSLKAIQNKLREQDKIKDQRKKLDILKGIPSFVDFEQSEWASDYPNAYENYQTRVSELPREIEQLQALLEIYENDNPDSFFHWAIDQKQALSRGQETVLMHLKDVVLKKPDERETGTRYAQNAGVLLNSFEEEEEGIWLKLGELREFVPYVKKQKFADAKTLKSAIAKDKQSLRKGLEKAQDELETLKRLNNELVQIGYNADFFEVYKEHKKIEFYDFDPMLNENLLDLVQENIENIDNYDKIKKEYLAVAKEVQESTRQQIEMKLKMESVSESLDKYNAQVERLKEEFDYHVSFDASALKRLTIDELFDRKQELDKKTDQLISEKEASMRNITSFEATMASCREREKQLSLDMEKQYVSYEEKRRFLEQETELKFEEALQTSEYTEEKVKALQKEGIDAWRLYETEFTRIAQSFEETKDHKNPELETNSFNFHTLVAILCGKLGLDGLGPELEKLNEELKKFGDLQLTIIINVFSQVEKMFNGLKKLVTELNFFFKDNRISTGYFFRIDFNEKKDITIDWISKMRESAKVARFGADLFSEIEGQHSLSNSPEALIVNIAKTFSTVKACELEDLLNPKYYFELKVGLYDDKGNRYTGSGGQAYTALALLCIGRLSVIQRDRNRPGIRFIIIEELSNIDDTNFNLFPQVAEQFGYQLLTMTPKPFGSYSEEDWFLHMLVRGKDKDINYTPMSFFKTKNAKKLLKDFVNEVSETKRLN